MTSMMTTSDIGEKTFSFLLTGLSGQSYIDFGPPNTAAMSDPASVVYVPIKSENIHWTAEVTGFRWNAS